MPTISKFYSRDSDREREESRSKKEEKRRERGSKRSRSRSRSPRERDENVGSRKIRERNEKEKESSTSSSKKKKGEIDIGEIVNSADKVSILNIFKFLKRKIFGGVALRLCFLPRLNFSWALNCVWSRCIRTVY